jgi:hypothetical protein
VCYQRRGAQSRVATERGAKSYQLLIRTVLAVYSTKPQVFYLSGSPGYL